MVPDAMISVLRMLSFKSTFSLSYFTIIKRLFSSFSLSAIRVVAVVVQLLVMSNSLQSHKLQHSRLPCPSLFPRDCTNSCPLSQWCQTTISSSVFPFSSCPQSFPKSGSFSTSQLFASGSQSIRASVSASVLPMSIQNWFPLGWTGLTSLQSKGLRNSN